MEGAWVDDVRLFKRETFRNWMIRLNRRGGVALLDALPEPALLDLVQKEAGKALEETEE